MKKRLDFILLERKLASSREKAQGLILAGQVLVNDVPVFKAGQQFQDTVSVRIRGNHCPFVSRGGLKLVAALEHFKISVAGKIAMDVGASTGGFTHVLLQKQIEKVYAIDVGHNQLDWVVRSDPRVQVFEGTNARYLEFSQIGEKVQLLVADVSFISLEKILPNICQFAQLQTDWITLIKPQFEVGQHKVGKGGVVKSEEDRLAAVDRITSFCKNLGLTRYGLMASPIVGANGNQEFLAHWRLN